jgi:hypothetical protein
LARPESAVDPEEERVWTARGLLPLVLGVCLIVAAALETPAVLGILDRATVSVRPATPEEAPSAAHAGHTLVGRPDNTPSALPLLQTLGLRLLLLGALVALGGGLVAWGLCLVLPRVRSKIPPSHG